MGKEEAALDRNLIIGTWKRAEWDLYHTLYFQDSIHIGLDTHIDTIFFLEYEIKKNELLLYDKNQQLIKSQKILKLSSDSLVLESLLDKPQRMAYARKEGFN